MFSHSEKEHLAHLRQLFERLREYGLVISISKCKFGVADIDFLGHRINKHGVTPLEKKVQAVIEFPKAAATRS